MKPEIEIHLKKIETELDSGLVDGKTLEQIDFGDSIEKLDKIGKGELLYLWSIVGSLEESDPMFDDSGKLSNAVEDFKLYKNSLEVEK